MESMDNLVVNIFHDNIYFNKQTIVKTHFSHLQNYIFFSLDYLFRTS